jgi:S1-C subfamily serine protease
MRRSHPTRAPRLALVLAVTLIVLAGARSADAASLSVDARVIDDRGRREGHPVRARASLRGIEGLRLRYAPDETAQVAAYLLTPAGKLEAFPPATGHAPLRPIPRGGSLRLPGGDAYSALRLGTGEHRIVVVAVAARADGAEAVHRTLLGQLPELRRAAGGLRLAGLDVHVLPFRHEGPARGVPAATERAAAPAARRRVSVVEPLAVEASMRVDEPPPQLPPDHEPLPGGSVASTLERVFPAAEGEKVNPEAHGTGSVAEADSAGALPGFIAGLFGLSGGGESDGTRPAAGGETERVDADKAVQPAAPDPAQSARARIARTPIVPTAPARPVVVAPVASGSTSRAVVSPSSSARPTQTTPTMARQGQSAAAAGMVAPPQTLTRPERPRTEPARVLTPRALDRARDADPVAQEPQRTPGTLAPVHSSSRVVAVVAEPAMTRPPAAPGVTVVEPVVAMTQAPPVETPGTRTTASSDTTVGRPPGNAPPRPPSSPGIRLAPASVADGATPVEPAPRSEPTPTVPSPTSAVTSPAARPATPVPSADPGLVVEAATPQPLQLARAAPPSVPRAASPSRQPSPHRRVDPVNPEGVLAGVGGRIAAFVGTGVAAPAGASSDATGGVRALRVDGRQGSAVGSVVVVAPGLAVTAATMVRDARAISVSLADGRRVPARVLRHSDALGLAVLEVESAGPAAPPLALAPARRGMPVTAVQHGRGALIRRGGIVVTAGPRPGTWRSHDGVRHRADVLSLSAQGGPPQPGAFLLDEAGALVGMLVQTDGEVLALPADSLRRFAVGDG